MNKNINGLLLFLLSLVLLIPGLSCSGKKVKENADNKSTSCSIENLSPEEFEKRYMKEGFISDRTFRIIILAPVEECESDIDAVQEKARKRAISTLQKYLISENRIVNQKSTAEIINIVNTYGMLIKKDIRCQNNYVFFYDIERDNLQRHVNTISKPRE
ncbi:MAG: hypothetical protein CVV44_03005 [Spirochaetae bacterium HGW-Spirochaetae-1]|jgi:hypothetical protein|nr:MAG: hypothetical protein CVV44_03005 [Spirochaetae bacterium HGW-Spirochaetae-1]